MQLIHGETIEEMKKIPNESVDMILADLPYGTTANKWDSVIPFDDLWKQYKRIIKEHGAILLFGQEPFSSALRMSGKDIYRCDWYWDKKKGGSPFLAKIQPMRVVENISLFSKGKTNYYPIMAKGKMYRARF